MALKLDLAPGDAVRIGDSVIKLEEKSGKRARISIDSNEDIQAYKAGAKIPSSKALSRVYPTERSEKPHAGRPVLQRTPITA